MELRGNCSIIRNRAVGANADRRNSSQARAATNAHRCSRSQILAYIFADVPFCVYLSLAAAFVESSVILHDLCILILFSQTDGMCCVRFDHGAGTRESQQLAQLQQSDWTRMAGPENETISDVNDDGEGDCKSVSSSADQRTTKIIHLRVFNATRTWLEKYFQEYEDYEVGFFMCFFPPSLYLNQSQLVSELTTFVRHMGAHGIGNAASALERTLLKRKVRLSPQFHAFHHNFMSNSLLSFGACLFESSVPPIVATQQKVFGCCSCRRKENGRQCNRSSFRIHLHHLNFPEIQALLGTCTMFRQWR